MDETGKNIKSQKVVHLQPDATGFIWYQTPPDCHKQKRGLLCQWYKLSIDKAKLAGVSRISTSDGKEEKLEMLLVTSEGFFRKTFAKNETKKKKQIHQQ